jgi:hypothetical protein
MRVLSEGEAVDAGAPSIWRKERAMMLEITWVECEA